MTVKVDNDRALKKLVAQGLIPSIEEQIQLFRSGEEKSLYNMAFAIGEYVDAYHKVCMTGNSVACVKKCEIKEKSE